MSKSGCSSLRVVRAVSSIRLAAAVCEHVYSTAFYLSKLAEDFNNEIWPLSVISSFFLMSFAYTSLIRLEVADAGECRREIWA